MAKSKKGGGTPKGKGPSNSTPHRHRGRPAYSSRTSGTHTSNSYDGSGRAPTFSLRDEARNTERHHSFWSSDLKLRHKQINFISAGTLHGDDPKPTGNDLNGSEDKNASDNLSAMALMSIQSDGENSSSSSSASTPNSENDAIIPLGNKFVEHDPQAVVTPAPIFLVDTTGTQTIQTGLPPPKVRSASSTSSDSSEEVILFKGRKGPQSRCDSPSVSKQQKSSRRLTKNSGRAENYETIKSDEDSMEKPFSSVPPSQRDINLAVPSVSATTTPTNSGRDESSLNKKAKSQKPPRIQPLNYQSLGQPKASMNDASGTSIANIVPTLVSDDPPSQTWLQLNTAIGSKSDASQSEGSEDVLSTFMSKRLAGRSPWEIGTTPWVHRSKPGVGWTPAEALPCEPRPRKNRQRRRIKQDEQDEAVHDYMENVKEQLEAGELSSVLAQSSFGRRDLSLDDGNDWSPNVPSSDTANHSNYTPSGQEKKDYTDGDEWNSVMLDDFNNMSTSSDVMDSIERIVAKRQRKRGPQYLVVYEGSHADDARWLPDTFLTTRGDLELIRVFEEKLLQNAIQSSDSSNFDDEDGNTFEDSDSDSTKENVDDVDDDFQDEKDIVARRLERMTDEQIARRLAKQEELGLGSEEVLLFDEEDGFELFEETATNIMHSPALGPSRRERARQRNKKTRANFPSASLMAEALEQDPYNGFDIMDTERPSLKKKHKGRQGVLPVELSDSEIETHLRTVWETDRKKKRFKKQEREQLRDEGLLGKKNKFKADLSIKYKDGFTMSEIQNEIKEFLISEHTSLALPPMEAHERAFVHRFSNALGLTSKSVGSGNNRFTNLSKTTRTRTFNENHFEGILHNKAFRNGPGTGAGRKLRKHAKGFSKPVVSYRDGEVVGASAPEIGADNRGRAMLEKMGWSSGTALGALNNKGILQPIAHTVKTGKAGLK